MIGVFLGLICVALMVCFIVLSIKSRGGKTKNAARTVFASLAVVSALCLLVLPMSIHTVEAGNVAVVKEMGKIVGTREAGTHFDLWVTNSYQRYDTKVQNVDIATAAYSSDAQTMDVAMTLQYQESHTAMQYS